MLRISTPHLRLRHAAVVALALVAVSLALLIPRGAFAGAIEDQLQQALGRLDTSDLQTGVLYDRVLPLSGIERFAGDGRAVASRALWRQLYEELRRASADPTQRPSAETLIERARRRQGAVPLAVVFDGYERIRKDALERGAIRIVTGISCGGAARHSKPTQHSRPPLCANGPIAGAKSGSCSTATTTFPTAGARLPDSRPTSTTGSGFGP